MMKIAKGALSMLLSIVLVVGLFPNLAYAVGPASAKSEEQGPARPAPEVPVTEELVVLTSGNVSFELAEDNSLSKQASAGASRLKAVFGSSRMRALVADAVEGASSEAASDAAEGEVDAGVAEQPLVLSTPDEVGSLRSGGDAEERVMDGMSAMDEAPSRAPTAISGGYSYRQVSGGVEVTGYSGAGGDIVVPDALDGSPVVSIAARAFMNNASLSSVVLPSSVSKVGDRAFWGCSS